MSQCPTTLYVFFFFWLGGQRGWNDSLWQPSVVSSVKAHWKVKEAVDRDGTETQRSMYLKVEGMANDVAQWQMLHQGFSDSAGKVLHSLERVWVTDIWVIVSSLQLPLYWTTLNNKQRLWLTASLHRPSRSKLSSLSLHFWFLELRHCSFQSSASCSVPHCLYLSHRAHLLRPICMRPNCCVRVHMLHVSLFICCLTVMSVSQNILCLGGFILLMRLTIDS